MESGTLGNPAERGLTARQARALELALEGLTTKEIAEEFKVTPRAVRKWLASPEVKAAARRLRDERLRQLAAQALLQAQAALDVLAAVARDPQAPAQARVAAAGRLLEAALQLMEAADLTERVEGLELVVSEVTARFSRRR